MRYEGEKRLKINLLCGPGLHWIGISQTEMRMILKILMKGSASYLCLYICFFYSLFSHEK